MEPVSERLSTFIFLGYYHILVMRIRFVKSIYYGLGGFMRRASKVFRDRKKPAAPKVADKPKKNLAPWQIKNLEGPKKKEVVVKKKFVRVDSAKKVIF